MKPNICIYGRCVARDLFEIGRPENKESKYTICQYLSDVNLLKHEHKQCTSVRDIGLSKEQFVELPFFGESIPKYVRRMIYVDLCNAGYEYLFAKEADYLLIDPSILSIPLYVSEDRILTKSFRFTQYQKQLANYGLIEHLEQYHILDISKMDRQLCKKNIQAMLEKILEHFREEQIILLEVKQADILLSHGILQNYPLREELLRFQSDCYNLICSLLPNAHKITFPEYFRIADSAHKWGKHPMHFIKEYYQYALQAVDIICQNHTREQEANELEKLIAQYAVLMANKSRDCFSGTIKYQERKNTANSKLLSLYGKCMEDVVGEQIGAFFKERQIHSVGIVAAANETTKLVKPILQKNHIKIVFEANKGYNASISVDAIFNASLLIPNQSFQKFYDVPIYNMEDILASINLLHDGE